jgi:hypothetical protein
MTTKFDAATFSSKVGSVTIFAWTDDVAATAPHRKTKGIFFILVRKGVAWISSPFTLTHFTSQLILILESMDHPLAKHIWNRMFNQQLIPQIIAVEDIARVARIEPRALGHGLADQPVEAVILEGEGRAVALAASISALPP